MKYALAAAALFIPLSAQAQTRPHFANASTSAMASAAVFMVRYVRKVNGRPAVMAAPACVPACAWEVDFSAG